MKKTLIGIAMLISGALLNIGILLSAAIVAAETTSWEPNLGKLGTVIMENNLDLPLILANILFALALVILAKEYFDKV